MSDDKKDEAMPGWAAKLMQKVDYVGIKVDNMTSSVDNAVKVAVKAKEQVEKIDAKMTVAQNDISS